MQLCQQSIRTLPVLLDFCEKKYAARDAFVWKSGEAVHSISYARFVEQVRALAAQFAAQTSQGAHIAIVGANSYQWLLGWFATLCAGRVVVPLDPQLPRDDLLALLAQSDTQLLLHDKTFDDIAAAFGKSICLNELPIGGQVVGWPCDVQPDDLAAILFTSGTTGKQKGVMLSHWNFMSNILSSCRHLDLVDSDVLVVLPLHHSASIIGLLVQLPGGCTLALCRLTHFAKDLLVFAPKYGMVVPLLAEKMIQQIWGTAKKHKQEAQLQALLAGGEHLALEQRRKLCQPVLAAFGGKLEWMLCGGAAISDEYVCEFLRFGIEILPAYGITECAPGVALTQCGTYRTNSAGQIMDCNEVKIERGEILVKGDNVFMGYYKDEAATCEAFTTDGWFKTGDIGHLDEDNYLYITGRLKNLIIFSNGKNVSPEALEQTLVNIPYIKEALVYEQDGEIAAELFLDEETPDASKRLEADLEAINRQQPAYQQITKISLRNTEFPKTTSKKIIRK